MKCRLGASGDTCKQTACDMTAQLSLALLLHLFAFQPLQAAVMGVPFVDPLTTERDTTLPLTVGEWEEWGASLHLTACLNVIVPLPVAGCPLERQTVHCFWSKISAWLKFQLAVFFADDDAQPFINDISLCR